MPFLIPVVAAIGGGSALAGSALIASTAAGVYGASKNASAIKNATNAQTAQADAGIEETQRQFDITQANLQPNIAAGHEALSAQRDLLGLGGGPAQDASIKALMDSPLYQSLFRNGQETILQNASATGGLRGGNTQRSLADFGSDTLAQVIEAQLTKLGGLSGAGANTAGTLGGLGADNSQAIAQLLAGKGSNQAGGILGVQSANNQGLAALLNAVGQGLSGLRTSASNVPKLI